MSPAADEPDRGRMSPLGPLGPGREGAAALRRRYLRRRATAGAAVLLALVWIGSLVSSGGSARHPASAAGRPSLTTAQRSAATARDEARVAAEQAREAEAIKAALGYTAYVTAGSAGRREMALTFDDGPGPFTPQVLSILRRMHAPATFFLVGREVKDFGTYIPAELSAGFAVGNHTQDHSPMAQLSRRDQVAQLLDQVHATSAYGVPFPHLFRPPYGSFDATTLTITKKLKMLTILWTIDSADFRQPGVNRIVNTVLSGARPGAIVLMHDAGGPRAQTVAALPRVIAGLRRRHYTLVTVPRLLADDPPLESQEVPPTGLAGG